MSGWYRTRVLTLTDVLLRRAASDGDRVALDFEDRSFTFRDLQARADEWAARLHAAGVAPRTRVALMSANRPELVFSVYGALWLGASVVMVSPAWKATEVEHACEVASPAVVMGDDTGCSLLAAALPSAPVVSFDGAPSATVGDAPPPA